MRGVPKLRCYEVSRELSDEAVTYSKSTAKVIDAFLAVGGKASLLGAYVVLCSKLKQPIVYPLFLDKVYVWMRKKVWELRKIGLLRRVPCSAEEADFHRAYIVKVAYGERIEYGGYEVGVIEPRLERIPRSVLFSLLACVVPREVRNWHVRWFGVREGLLVRCGGGKYVLTREGLRKVVNEVERRYAAMESRVAGWSVRIWNELRGDGRKRKRSKLPGAVAISGLVEVLLKEARWVEREAMIRTDKMKEYAELVHVLVNLIDDYWLSTWC